MSASAKDTLVQAAAVELVAGNGFFEMKAVAKRAKVSVGLAYHHFGSKAGLIAAVVEDFWDALDRDVLEVVFDQNDYAAGERERVHRFVAFHYKSPLSAMMLGRLGTEPQVVEVTAARMENHIALGTRNIRGAQKRGQIPAHLDPELLTAMVLGGARLAIETALKWPERPDFDVLVAEIWTFVSSAMHLNDSNEEREDVR
jgi:AcrR family transcriptional regulator